jgi:hypothetical protein
MFTFIIFKIVTFLFQTEMNLKLLLSLLYTKGTIVLSDIDEYKKNELPKPYIDQYYNINTCIGCNILFS